MPRGMESPGFSRGGGSQGTEWWRLAFCRLIVFCFAKRTGVFGALFFVFIILFTCYTEYVHIEMKEETNEHHNQRPNQPSHRIRMGRLPQNLPARQRRRRQERQIRGTCSPRTEKPDTRCCQSRNYSAYGTNPARSASSTTGRSTRIMFPNATRSPSPSKRVEREKP